MNYWTHLASGAAEQNLLSSEEELDENAPGPLTSKLVFINVRDENQARILRSCVIKLDGMPLNEERLASIFIAESLVDIPLKYQGTHPPLLPGYVHAINSHYNRNGYDECNKSEYNDMMGDFLITSVTPEPLTQTSRM